VSSNFSAGAQCPQCHRWIPTGTEFCGFCGTPKNAQSQLLASAPPVVYRTCTHCNAPLDASQDYCANCGWKTGHVDSPVIVNRAPDTYPYNGWAAASLGVACCYVISVFPDVVFGRLFHAKYGFTLWPTAAIGLAATILGWIALRKFRTSQIPMRGRFAALLGLRLGISGFILGTVMAIAVPAFFTKVQSLQPGGILPTSSLPSTVVVPAGRTENISLLDDGLSNMRVIALHMPLHLIGPPPYPNNVYWAVGVRVCAGPNGSNQSYSPFTYLLHTVEGDMIVSGDFQFNSAYRALPAIDLKPRQCEVGYIEARYEASMHPVPYQVQVGGHYLFNIPT
jgi:RNA polymerase subunit RPABC4/transcription elongation factor Spt4